MSHPESFSRSTENQNPGSDAVIIGFTPRQREVLMVTNQHQFMLAFTYEKRIIENEPKRCANTFPALTTYLIKAGKWLELNLHTFCISINLYLPSLSISPSGSSMSKPAPIGAEK